MSKYKAAPIVLVNIFRKGEGKLVGITEKIKINEFWQASPDNIYLACSEASARNQLVLPPMGNDTVTIIHYTDSLAKVIDLEGEMVFVVNILK